VCTRGSDRALLGGPSTSPLGLTQVLTLSVARLSAFLQFLLLAILAAALFGAVHDQISYTVSPEYFTKFKFHQFGLLDPAVPERVRAAIVGVLASWWMGIPIGILCGAAGFIQRTAPAMRRALYWTLPVVLGFALLSALAGLIYGFVQTRTFDLANYSGWFIPHGLDNPGRFLCAGYMHNSAYIGGALGIPVAWLFNIWFRWREA
jgi:hypothetical protein